MFTFQWVYIVAAIVAAIVAVIHFGDGVVGVDQK